MDPQLAALLKAHSEFFSILDNGKVKCEINGHCFPPKFEVVEAFINGSKFQTLRNKHLADNALAKYEPFIVCSTNFPNMLFCALTGQLLEKSLAAVQRHMRGKRFQRAKERFAEDQLELRAEPSLESLGFKVPADARLPGARGTGGDPKAAERQREVQGEGSGDGPGFWAPSDEDGTSERGMGSSKDECGAGAAAAARGCAAGARQRVEEGDAMEEDSPGAEARGAAAPVKHAAGGAKHGGARAANGGSTQRHAGAVRRKQNYNRSRAAKRPKP